MDNAIICLETRYGVRGIFCNSDGSLSKIENILLSAYRKRKKVEFLISGGNIFSLGYFLKPHKDKTPKGVSTVFLERDMGLKYQDYFFELNKGSLITEDVPWVYVFLQNNTWVYYHKSDREWKILNKET